MILLFNDAGWEVMTSAWTVASKAGNEIEICYVWSATGGFGLTSTATGVARKKLPLTMEQFQRRLSQARANVVDLR